jgi:hypothetical protein
LILEMDLFPKGAILFLDRMASNATHRRHSATLEMKLGTHYLTVNCF